MITQALGEIDTSQSVKAYSASMVISGDTPGASLIRISMSLAVLSITCLILIFPLSLALTIESIKDVVVVPKGISRIAIVLESTSSMVARTLTFPPRCPSL